MVKHETFIKMKLFEIRVGILEKWVIFLVIGDILGKELFLGRNTSDGRDEGWVHLEKFC